MTPADVLDAAAALIERVGWDQGQSVSDRGAFCVEAAIRRNALDGFPALYSTRLADAATDALALRLLGDPSRKRLIAWNDAEHRTKEQVVKELRACAADLRGDS